MKLHQDTTKEKKVMAFDNSSTKAVACDHPQKGVNYHFFFAAIGQAVRRWKARAQKLKYAVSASLATRKNIIALSIFLPENLENYRSTELYDASLEGSTIFL